MRYIKSFKIFESELDIPNFSDEETYFQRKMQLKHNKKYFKPYLGLLGNGVDLKPYSPIKKTDIPLDVYLNQQKNQSQNLEQEIINTLNVYDSIEDFKLFEPVFYKWLVDNKKGLDFLPMKYFKNGIKKLSNLNKSSIKPEPKDNEPGLSKSYLKDIEKIKSKSKSDSGPYMFIRHK